MNIGQQEQNIGMRKGGISFTWKQELKFVRSQV